MAGSSVEDQTKSEMAPQDRLTRIPHDKQCELFVEIFLRACAYETPLVHTKTFLPTSMKNIFPFHAGPRFGSFRQAKLVMTVHCRQLCSFSSLMVQKLHKFRETVVTKGKTMTSPTGVVGFGLDGPGGFSIRLR